MYTPHTDADIAAMLADIGVATLDELVRVDPELAPKAPIDLAPALPERDLSEYFAQKAAANEAHGYRSFLGMGAYKHYIPPVVGNLAMRGEFVSAYTPYQAEASQGYLQAIYEWQTYIALLTGLDVANASVYDGATALAEAAIMAVNATGNRTIIVSSTVHPRYREVLDTYAKGIGLSVEELPFAADGTTDYAGLAERLGRSDVAAVAVQSPNVFGVIDTPPAHAMDAIRAAKVVPIAVIAEAMSMAVLATPASWGAEIAVGEGQSFGIPVSYGGPYVGFMASTAAHMRRIPGRLAGRATDIAGNTAYTLTLQAREQHIRRERATSNICTNQAHCALTATIYLAALGERGLRDCAVENMRRSRDLAQIVATVDGCSLAFDAPYFNEFVVRVPTRAQAVIAGLERYGIIGGIDLGRYYPELEDCMLMTATEMTTDDDLHALDYALRRTLAEVRGVAHV